MAQDIYANYKRLVFAVRPKNLYAKSKTTAIEYFFIAACFEKTTGDFVLTLKLYPRGLDNGKTLSKSYNNTHDPLLDVARILDTLEYEGLSVLHIDDAYGIPLEEKILMDWNKFENYEEI